MRIYLYLFILQFLLESSSFPDFIYSQTIIGEISLPSKEYHRIGIEQNSFAEYLRKLPLKNEGSEVINYRGGIFKSDSDTSVAFVVDLDIQGRRLEQCMDILVRLYADYLWRVNQNKNFILPLPGGTWLKWRDWNAGFRPVFKGIDVSMIKSDQPDSSYNAYQSYLNTVYSESHTQQFYHNYRPLERSEVQIGDIIIKKGTKGHAIMIVDMAKDQKGNILALIGNGDTPACQFFLLNHAADRPWIPLNFDKETLDLPLKRKISWDGLRRLSLPKD